MPADILPFLEGHSFDAEATHTMGKAYDKARAMLHDKRQPSVVQEIIAMRIIEIAATGERDADQLARQALQSLRLTLQQT